MGQDKEPAMIHHMAALRPKRSGRTSVVPMSLASANQNFPVRSDRMISLTIALRYLAACDRGLSVRFSSPPRRHEPK
jgi:hypothetical protein